MRRDAETKAFGFVRFLSPWEENCWMTWLGYSWWPLHVAFRSDNFDRLRRVIGIEIQIMRRMFTFAIMIYRTGGGVYPHRECGNGPWHQLVFRLWSPRRGGKLYIDGRETRRLTIIRGDKQEHWVTTVEEGTRVIFFAQFFRSYTYHTKAERIALGGK
jgi:hypothetical protein